MHIETINTQGEYKCIIMGGDDPCWVYRRKGYGAIDWLNHCTALWDTDGIYSGPDCGRAEHFLSLVFILVLIIDWASQYEFYGGSGL